LLNPLFDVEFEIPALHQEKLGDRFCRVFITDTDDELIFQNPNAKHLIIDFEHLEQKLITPPLFPFVIENLYTQVEMLRQTKYTC
jgi:hypothetical protein